MKRVLVRLGLAVVILGVAGVLVLNTSPVASLAARRALPLLNDRLNGVLTVERASGSLLKRLVLTGVALRDSTGAVVLAADRAVISYSLIALIRGRFRFGPIHLTRPTVRLLQAAPGAPYGLARVFARKEEGGAAGRVDLRVRDLAIEGGVVEATIPRTRMTAPDDRDGPALDTIRVTGLDVEIPELHLRTAPDAPRDAGVRIAGATARVVEPGVVLRDLAGEVAARGDSISVTLARLDLPQTSLAGRGWVAMRPAGGRPTFDGDLRILRLNTTDLAAISRWVPPAWVMHGDVRATSSDPGVTDIRLGGFEIRAAGGVARLTGGMTLHPDGSWTTRDVRVEMDSVNAQRLADAYDLPGLGGRVTGTLTADGPRQTLDVAVDLALVQSTVSPPARSRLEGSGQVAAIPGAPAVHRFDIRAARLDLRSARTVAPRLPLVGTLGLTGQVAGSARELTFDGTLRYEEQALPASTVRASVHVTRDPRTVVAATLTLDSLRLEGFRRSFPGHALRGAFGGEVRANGALDSLAVDARTSGAAGTLAVSGVTRIGRGSLAIEALAGQVQGLNLQAIDSALPVSNLTALLTGALAVRDDTLRSAEIRLSLDSSAAGRATIDTVALSARLADGVLSVDSLHVRATGLEVDGGGSFGWAKTPGSLALRVKADSLNEVRSLLSLWPQALDTTFLPRRGALLLTGTLEGSRSDYRADVTLEARDVSTPKGRIHTAALTGSFSAPARELQMEGTVDSLGFGGTEVGRIDLEVAGTLDALVWRSRAVVDEKTELSAAGTAAFGGRRAVVVDSLAARRGAADWRLDPGGRIAWSPDGWVLDSISLRRVGGDGRIALDGQVPAPDSLRIRAAVERLSLGDLEITFEEDAVVSGTVDADLELAGSLRHPTGRARFALTGAAFGDDPIPDLQADARFDGGSVRGEVAMAQGQDRLLTLRGQLPLGGGGAGLNLELSANHLPFALVDPLIPNVSDVAGWLDARVTVRGSLDNPAFEGTALVTDGAATLRDMGVRYDSIAGRFSLSGQRMQVERLRLKAGEDSAVVTGSVTFERLQRPMLDLTLDAWRFPVMNNPDLLSGSASAHVTITGPLMGAALRGRAGMTQGTAFPDQFIQKQVIDLSDSLYAQFVDTTVLRREKLGAGAFQIFVDSLRIDSLEVDLGRDFWVRTPDAHIQLGGTLLLGKRGDRYLVDGRVDVLRGTYRLRLAAGVTREFQVERGSVRYFGTEDLNAELDIDAHHKLRSARGDDVVVSVHIGGTIRRPELQLSANVRPPLSDTEIVSYLVFGAPSVHAFVGDGGGQRRSVFQQSAQRFVGAMSGQMESVLVERLGLPVDVLRIKPGEVQSGLSGTELLIGKQVDILGRPSFLTASPRLCPRERLVSLERIGVSVETRLGARWGIAGSVDPARGCETSVASSSAPYQLGVDLFWEKR